MGKPAVQCGRGCAPVFAKPHFPKVPLVETGDTNTKRRPARATLGLASIQSISGVASCMRIASFSVHSIRSRQRPMLCAVMPKPERSSARIGRAIWGPRRSFPRWSAISIGSYLSRVRNAHKGSWSRQASAPDFADCERHWSGPQHQSATIDAAPIARATARTNPTRTRDLRARRRRRAPVLSRSASCSVRSAFVVPSQPYVLNLVSFRRMGRSSYVPVPSLELQVAAAHRRAGRCRSPG
jgi:hypothetical protein